MMRRLLIASFLVVAVAAPTAWYLVHSRQAPAAATVTVPTGTARVARTDIVSSQRINGTLGYGTTFTVGAPAGATPDQVQQAQSAVTADQVALSSDQQAAADAASGTQQVQHQAAAAVAAAQAKLQADRATLQSLQTNARLDGAFTWLPALGATVSQGQTLYAIDGRPVVLLYGTQPAWRALAYGASGDDVRQLERDLTDLGFANASNLAIDGNFTGSDAAAVRRWQASLGLPQTGVVRLGEAVFVTSSVRVAAVHATLGTQVMPGAQIVDLTATSHTVTAQVDTSHEQLVHPGDHVTILMPDGHTNVQGTVASISGVATAPAQSSSQNGQGGQGGSATPTVAVTITLADNGAAGSYDEAPVYVSIATASKRGVLAVPVVALLAQPNGGYAVAVRSGGSRRLVTVEAGLYGDNGLVEVSGAGLAEGLLVEVPSQ